MNLWLLVTLIILALVNVVLLLFIRRMRSNVQIVKTDEFYEHMLDAVPDPIFVKNTKHQWVYGNKGFSKILRLNREEYIGKSDYDIFPKEMADVFWNKDNETLEGLKVTENEELIPIDGEIRTILTKKTPHRLQSGETILVGVIRDITERKIQERTIENLFQMIESSSDLYCIFDLQGKPTYLNRQAIEQGMSYEIKHYHEIFDEKFDQCVIEAELKQKESWEGEVLLHDFKTNSSASYYWARILKIKDEHNEFSSLAFIATNLQHRKESEAQLIYTSKMASLGEMAGGIAHEINNPLAIISGYSEQLIRLYESGKLNQERILVDLKKIKDTAFRISKIIQGLKAFSRSGENDPEASVELCSLIEEALDFGRERMNRENIEIKCEFSEKIIVNCRPTQIQQVLINLFNNSIDAITGTSHPWIKIECQLHKNEAWITVTDSGKGIPLPIRKNLMTPFFTTKEIGKGTGLGLSISKGIMESNHGELVYVENSPNTAFRLVFHL